MKQALHLLSAFFLFSLLPLVSSAQLDPLGSNCANPVIINSIPYTSPELPKYTTCGKGNTYQPTHACANTYTQGEDFLFRFIPNAGNSCITITLSALTVSYSLFVFEGCPDDPNAKCIAQDINLNDPTDPFKSCKIKDLQLEAGRTYYIMASGLAGCYNFDLNIAAGACSLPPLGTGCVAARTITSAPFTDAGRSTCNREPVFNRGNMACGSSNYLDGAQYTYKYTPPETQCIKIKANSDTLFTGMFLYRGCPTDPTSACIGFDLNDSAGKMLINTTLIGGNDYYVVLGTRTDSAVCSNFDFSLIAINDSGSVCAKAYAFPPGSSTFKNHTTQCKGDDYDNHPGCNPGPPNYMDGEEVVYTFNGLAGKCVNLFLESSQTVSGGMFILDKCPDDPTANCLSFAGKDFTPSSSVASMQFTLPYTGTFYVVVGVSDATMVMDYDLTLMNSADTGSTCAIAHNITVPYYQQSMTVACKGNDYNQSHVCKSNYMAGNDYVFKFTATKNECLRFSMASVNSAGGIFLSDKCPNVGSANCLAAGLCPTPPCDSVSIVYTVTAGQTYYLIVAGITGNQTMTFDINIERLKANSACQYCETDVCIACQNVGFERMDFTGWQGFTGSFLNPRAMPGISGGHVNNTDSRHTIMSAGSYDPVVGPSLKTVSPLGGEYAVRLGNKNTGAQGEVLSYTFTVDSNSQNFLYYFAVVFEDPNHAPEEQPFFMIRMFDEDNVEIECAHFEVRAGPTALLPGFQNAASDIEVRWRDWGLAAVPLKDYIGRTMTIEFTTLDCSAGAHYGYAYIDAFCGKLGILASNYYICEGDPVTLKAPDGFASYLWNTGEITQTITVTTAGDYSCEARAWSSILAEGCPATFTTTIAEAPYPTAEFDFVYGCKDSIIDFFDNSTSTDTTPVIKWEWSFDDTQTDTAQHPIHHFPGAGTFEVTMVATNTTGCRDTVTKVVDIPDYIVLISPNALDSIKICENSDAELYADSIKDAIYEWTGPGFSSILRAPVIPKIQLNQSGWYYLYVELSTDSCMRRFDSTFIEVVEFPELDIKQDTAICFLEKSHQLWATGGTSYKWYPSALFSNDSIANPIATVPKDTEYWVVIGNDLCPDSTLKVKVSHLSPKAPLKVSKDLDVCVGDSIKFSATANPDQFFQWTGPGNFGSTNKAIIFPKATLPQQGYYKVVAYLGPNKFCKFGEDSVRVAVHPLPIFNIQPASPLLCPGEKVTMSVTGGEKYKWAYKNMVPFAQTPTVDIPGDTTKMLYVWGEDMWGCKDTTNMLVRVKKDFFPELGPDLVRCVGDTAVLALNVSSFYQQPDDITWSTGEKTPSIKVTKNGLYSVIVKIQGCIKQDSIKVTFQDQSTFFLGPDIKLCEGQVAKLDLSAFGVPGKWQDGITAITRQVAYPGGTYSVVFKVGNCTYKDTIVIDFQKQHKVDIGPDSTFCIGQSLTVMSDQTQGSFLWTDGTTTSTDESIVVSSPGIHNITLQHSYGLCTATDQKLVNITTPVTPNLGPDVTVCQNTPTVLDPKISPPAQYSWSNGASTPTITTSNAGTYSVIITKNKCLSYDTINVFHDQVPVVNLGPDSTVCEGTAVTFDATVTGNATYRWSSGETTPTITKKEPGIYTVVVSRGQCSGNDAVQLNTDLIPVFDLGPGGNLCQGDQAVVTAPIPNATYSWSTGATGPSITVNAPGTYGLAIFRGKCSYSDNITYTFQAPPQLNLGPDVTLCTGDSVIFKSSVAADSYLWSNGATTPVIVAKDSGEYELTVTVGPCKAKDDAALQLDIPPVVDLGNDTLLCNAVNMVIDAGVSGATYLWNDGLTSRTRTITSPGLYSVQVTRGKCTSADDIKITVQPLHQVILPADTTLCEGEILLLSPVTNALSPSFAWSTAENSPVITVSKPGLYWLDVTSGVCSASDSINISYLPVPTVNLGPDRLVCLGDSILLDAAYPAASYAWNTGETTPAVMIRNSGTYSVRAYIGRCEGTDQVNLTFQTPPTVDIGPDTEICADETHTLIANVPLAQYFWNTGSRSPSIIVSREGMYRVDVVQGPCHVADEMELIVHPLPPALKDTLICPTDSAYVNAYCPGCTYKWSDGDTASGRWASPNTLHFVVITSDHGCVTETDKAVAIDPSCWDEIYVPNTFTPNGDQKNDLFKVSYGNVTVNHVMIVDRWGEKLFETNDPEVGWDGTYKNQPAKQDTYIWKIVYTNMYHYKREIRGHVNLLR